MERLNGKVAVVTGASSGIGYAIAKLYAAEGAKVILLARREKELKELAESIAAAGGEAVVSVGDMASNDDVKRAFDTAIEKFGKVDIVANVAGMVRWNDTIETVPDKDCYDMYDVNTMGAMRCCREAMKYMAPAKSGTFVFVGSVGGLLGHGGAAYAMTKGGMVALAKEIAFTHHNDGIRSNVICPDGVMTTFGFVDGQWVGMDEKMVKACSDHVCPGTPLCTAEEVANLALFLAGDESVAVNGQAIICDHGANI
ncbi:MAG: SDR family oxidoreductase [Oscillospiraceae bacterium]